MKSVIIKKLEQLDDYRNMVVEIIEDHPFQIEYGEGIKIIDCDEDYLYCHYLVERVFYQNTYNAEIDDFEKIEYKRIESIPFYIDFIESTLDILGNKQWATKVIEYLGKITKYKIAISDVQINLLKIIEICNKEKIQYSVTKLKISGYIFFDNIIGDCLLNLIDYPKAYDILKKYENQIVNVTLNVKLEEKYAMTFYKSGSISIYKDIESIDISFLRLIKNGM